MAESTSERIGSLTKRTKKTKQWVYHPESINIPASVSRSEEFRRIFGQESYQKVKFEIVASEGCLKISPLQEESLFSDTSAHGRLIQQEKRKEEKELTSSSPVRLVRRYLYVCVDCVFVSLFRGSAASHSLTSMHGVIETSANNETIEEVRKRVLERFRQS